MVPLTFPIPKVRIITELFIFIFRSLILFRIRSIGSLVSPGVIKNIILSININIYEYIFKVITLICLH